ncbi:copper homeostasis protein CutC [Ekhidna sp.]|uniref:copper homeostasis protein CutC n=1 Tax=Ekhidna sp. TaxID=2608089 RepID=UPI003297C5CC
MSYKIEICANSVQSAINAEQGGADRVELCDNLWEGGTTPSIATIRLTKKQLNIPAFVLIRPRGGDFVYSDMEFEIIKEDLIAAKEAGVNGVVSGVLLPDGKIDIKRTRELVALSSPLSFTFHRAFDQVPDFISGIEDLIQCGIQRVLTSGQKEKAIHGIANIEKMLALAADRITILAGGGINKKNVTQLYDIGCREFHFSAKTLMPGLAEQQAKVRMNGSPDISEDSIQVSDSRKILEVKKILDEKV